MTTIQYRTAARFEDKGYFVASTSSTTIYTPLTGTRNVCVYKGLHYGEDDPNFHPQPWDKRFVHLICIPLPSNLSLDDPARYAWLEVDRDAHFSHPGPAAVLGLLSPAFVDGLRTATSRTFAELDTLRASPPSPFTASTFNTPAIRRYQQQIRHYLARLAFPSTFSEAEAVWTNAQRIYLELRGRLTWIQDVCPLLTSPPDLPAPTRDIVGVLVDDFLLAEQLWQAGVPVWVCRPLGPELRLKVERWLTPDEVAAISTRRYLPRRGAATVIPDKRLERNEPNAMPLYVGPAIRSARYAAMARFVRRRMAGRLAQTWLPPTPVLQPTPAREPLAGPSRAPRQSANSARPQPYDARPSSAESGQKNPWKKGKKKSAKGSSAGSSAAPSNSSSAAPPSARNKWLEVDAPCMPPPIPAWKHAAELCKELGDGSRAARFGANKGYAMPDASMIAASTNRDELLRSFLLLQEPFIWRLGMDVKLLLSTQWRTVLRLLISEAGSKNTLAAAQRADAEALLLSCFEHKGMSVSLESLRAPSASWHGKSVPAAQPIPQAISQEILWYLYEVNFRCELLSLDEKAAEVGSDAEKALDRQLEVLDWIAHFESSAVPAWNKQRMGTYGFASDSQQERAEACMGLLAVMGGWSLSQTQLNAELLGWLAGLHRCGSVHEAVGELDAGVQALLERSVVTHYLQCYAHVFERAPSMPHRLAM